MFMMRGSRSLKRLVAIAGSALLLGLLLYSMRIPTHPEDALLLGGARFADYEGVRVVTGSIENVSNRAISGVFVEVDLLDGSSTWIGVTVASADELAGGEVWEFMAPVRFAEAESFDVNVRASAATHSR